MAPHLGDRVDYRRALFHQHSLAHGDACQRAASFGRAPGLPGTPPRKWRLQSPRFWPRSSEHEAQCLSPAASAMPAACAAVSNAATAAREKPVAMETAVHRLVHAYLDAPPETNGESACENAQKERAHRRASATD